MKIGIISGHVIPGLQKKSETIWVETPYGEICTHLSKFNKHEIYWINRHGDQGHDPPHKINYLGNMHAFASCHVSCIFSVATVGSMKLKIQPGTLVVPDDFIDFTKNRPYSFFDDTRVHVDMTTPFCSSLRQLLIASCTSSEHDLTYDHGVYLATEGPRLETAAEIRFFSKAADIVGMTVVPEVILAREKGICYAAVCLVCNMAAGLQHRLPADEIASAYKQHKARISTVLMNTIKSMDAKEKCTCPSTVQKARL